MNKQASFGILYLKEVLQPGQVIVDLYSIIWILC